MRNYKRKSNQTRPSEAGRKNMTKEFEKKHKDVEEGDGIGTEHLSEMFDIGVKARNQHPRGMNWTPEEFKATVADYFDYCHEKSLKPCKSGLRIFLGCSTSTYHAWYTQPEKYGAISEILQTANDMMETQYISRLEKYPTGNTFLLQTSHKHVKADKLDITTNGQNLNDNQAVLDAISKLGLDKSQDED